MSGEEKEGQRGEAALPGGGAFRMCDIATCGEDCEEEDM